MRVIAVLVRIELKDEEAARGFDALAKDTVAAVQALEPEALIYVVHKVEDSPLSRVFYEVYASPEARRHHESSEHMKRAFDEVGQYVESAQTDSLGEPLGKLG
jgi:quinol monooxygenase YgiN